MPYGTDDKKKLNRVSVEPDTHTWLVEQANALGESVGDFAGALLDAMSSSHEPMEWKGGTLTDYEGIAHTFDTDNLEAFWTWYKFTQEDRQRQRVHHAAAMYATNPTEAGAERLARMCELTGLDYAEVKERAEGDPYSSLVANTRNGTKFGECMQWLPSFLIEQGGQFNVGPLRAIANREGFTPSMLDRVKRAIRNDPDIPPIVSVRVGAMWAWKIDIELQESNV